MKKFAYLSLAAIGIMAAMALLFNPKSVAGSGMSSSSGPGTALPDSIQKIVHRACMDCHADDGNFMAKGKINFSVWNTYELEKQAGKANAMCKVLTKASMPPKKWRTNNPTDIPTQAEVDMICKWAKSLQK